MPKLTRPIVDGLDLLQQDQPTTPTFDPPRRPMVSEMLILLNALVRLYAGGTLSMIATIDPDDGPTITDFETVNAADWWGNWAPTGAAPVGS